MCRLSFERPPADLKASTNCELPTRGDPKVMHRTSAVGHCRPAQQAARVATAPPMQKPVQMMRRGMILPAAEFGPIRWWDVDRK